MRVLVAGATGVIGAPLVGLLVAAGHQVTGTTRSGTGAVALRAAGATPSVVDVFDREALGRAVIAATPEVVIHQLTDLPDKPEPARAAAMTERNARIRREGTRNLVEAAARAGARRVVAQSIAWAYAPGPGPHGKDDALDVGASGQRAISVGGVVELERLVTKTPGLTGVVLRYGQLYGPGTWTATPSGPVSVHVEAAAQAAALAVERGAGAYNIVDDGGTATNARARHELGWDPAFRR